MVRRDVHVATRAVGRQLIHPEKNRDKRIFKVHYCAVALDVQKSRMGGAGWSPSAWPATFENLLACSYNRVLRDGISRKPGYDVLCHSLHAGPNTSESAHPAP